MSRLPYNLETNKQEHDDASPRTKRVSMYGWDVENAQKTRLQTVINPNTGSAEVLVNLQGHQCPENSTTTQLLANGVFTGSGWQDTLDYGVLSINVGTDKDSATNGLDVQWSNDGVTVSDHDYFTILANNHKTFTFGPAQRYYRIVYTNGSSGTTTSFHLTSLLRKSYVKPSSHRINDSIVGQDDAGLVKAVLSAKRAGQNNVYNNIESDVSGNLHTVIGGITQDAGGRVRISQLTTLGDYKILNSDRALLIDNYGTGTGTFDNNKYNMSVTSGQWYVRQSHGNGTITVTSPGTIIAGGTISTGATFPVNILKQNFLAYLGSDIANVMDRYILCITPITANITSYSTLSFKEI